MRMRALLLGSQYLETSVDGEAAKEAGSTATVLLVGEGKMVVANVGDSKCVLCRAGASVDLTVEHRRETSESVHDVAACQQPLKLDALLWVLSPQAVGGVGGCGAGGKARRGDGGVGVRRAPLRRHCGVAIFRGLGVEGRGVDLFEGECASRFARRRSPSHRYAELP